MKIDAVEIFGREKFLSNEFCTKKFIIEREHATLRDTLCT